MTEPPSVSIAALQRQYESGESSPTGCVEHILHRIAHKDPDGRVFVHLDAADVRSQAARLEKAAHAGGERGALYGAPISVKDIIDVAGAPTRCGSPRQIADLAARDANVVARLRAAGAIIVGKVATTEFACAGYHPDVAPPLNPWSARHVPGVSSSGSAVSVAGGLAVASVGTDTGGSIRMPAAACGVVGLKPTFGAVGRGGIMALSPRLDHCGPIARCVNDAALLFGIMRGPDGADSATLGKLGLSASPRSSDGRKRIGWDETYASDDVDPIVRDSARAAIDVLSDAGHEVVSIDLSFVHGVCAFWKDLVACDAAVYLRDRLSAPDQIGPVINDILAHARGVSGARLAEAAAESDTLVRRLMKLFGDVDVLVTPTEPFVTPSWDVFPPQLITPLRALTWVLRFAAPYNFARCPALAVPFGVSPSGLPLSVQLVAPWGGEEVLFAIGGELERASPNPVAVPGG